MAFVLINCCEKTFFEPFLAYGLDWEIDMDLSNNLRLTQMELLSRTEILNRLTLMMIPCENLRLHFTWQVFFQSFIPLFRIIKSDLQYFKEHRINDACPTRRFYENSEVVVKEVDKDSKSNVFPFFCNSKYFVINW